jgi:hypothetical protein
MAGMLRSDGEFVVYVIKHRKDGQDWMLSSLDNFEFAGAVWQDSGGWNYPRREFSASADCWQKTGITGTFNRDAALAALTAISEANPDYEFGIFEVKLSQQSRAIGTMARMS